MFDLSVSSSCVVIGFCAYICINFQSMLFLYLYVHVMKSWLKITHQKFLWFNQKFIPFHFSLFYFLSSLNSVSFSEFLDSFYNQIYFFTMSSGFNVLSSNYNCEPQKHTQRDILFRSLNNKNMVTATMVEDQYQTEDTFWGHAAPAQDFGGRIAPAAPQGGGSVSAVEAAGGSVRGSRGCEWSGERFLRGVARDVAQ